MPHFIHFQLNNKKVDNKFMIVRTITIALRKNKGQSLLKQRHPTTNKPKRINKSNLSIKTSRVCFKRNKLLKFLHLQSLIIYHYFINNKLAVKKRNLQKSQRSIIVVKNSSNNKSKRLSSLIITEVCRL